MLGPHDLEDFYNTVDREREMRQASGAEPARRLSSAMGPLGGLAAMSRLARGRGMFGGAFGERG